MRKTLFLIYALALLFHSYAQHPLGGHKPKNLLVFEYFQAKQYGNVIDLLSLANDLSHNEKVLFELSNMKIGHDPGNPEQWIRINERYPLYSLVQFNYGEYAFYKGDTTTSRAYLSELTSRELSKEDRASYGFMNGILNLYAKKYKDAQNFFNYSKENGFTRENQLTYYQSFINYYLNYNNKALDGFEQLKDHPEYGPSSTFFIAKIQFELGNYDEVIALLQNELSEEISQINSGFHQLIGEAYARKKNVVKADTYFEQAIKKYPGRPTSALYYQAGITKFKSGNEEKALEYLTESGIGEAPYAQLSAFQLGRLHIKRNELEEALTAYTEASLSEDVTIQEESFFQTAKLHAKLKRYTEAINYSSDYLETFPNGQWKQEVRNIIVHSYLLTSNYDLALQLLETFGISNQVQREIYQKVTFQKALLLFNDGDFNRSQKWFEKSLNFPMDILITNDAYFYLGEIFSLQNLYQKAIRSYGRQSYLSIEAYYGIGYSYYNQQQYLQAIKYFKKATKVNTIAIRNDAKLRLADCFYATRSYAEALSIYESLKETDYIAYQKGLVLKNLGRNGEAISVLDRVSKSSGLKDDAQFDQAQIQFESARFEDAEASFTTFIDDYPNFELQPKAYLNRAISRSNLHKLELAQADYEYVVKNFIGTEEAFSAILGLQGLQQKGMKIRDLNKHIVQYKKAHPDDNNLEVVAFEAAKALYFDLDYIHATVQLKAFLNEYPQSKYKMEATYYLADSFYRLDQLDEAKTEFDKQKFLHNAYTGRILIRLGDINTALGKYEEAVEAYQLLIDHHLTPKDTYNARYELMNAYYLSDKYAETIAIANQIINADWKPLNADQTAMLFRARSWLNLNYEKLAIKDFRKLSDGIGAIAAESTYQLASIRHSSAAYQESLEILFDLNIRFGTYTEWVDKSYLLIADNYIAMDQLFQAKATLRSIIQHSQNEAVRTQAQKKLSFIQKNIELDTLQIKN